MIESEPIRRRKLSHEVLDRLLARITQGELAAGDFLPSERDLMGHYGVGRPAVREAMQALERMGFIAISHGERARIIAPTARTMIDQVAHSAKHLLATSAGSLAQLKEARVFFEAGMTGHRLYLAAEAMGFQATGIGAFYANRHKILVKSV